MEQITSRKNAYVRHVRQLAADGAYRREAGEYLCDGRKTLREALAFGARVTSILWKERAEEGDWGEAVQYLAPKELFDYASPMVSSPGPLFTVAIRGCGKPGRLRRALILEGVQDPGNVGTVIRTANAFGIDAVILTGDCADLYQPKTVRSTMGAIFRQTVLQKYSWPGIMLPIWSVSLKPVRKSMIYQPLSMPGLYSQRILAPVTIRQVDRRHRIMIFGELLPHTSIFSRPTSI